MKSEVENKIAGCLPDSQGMLETMYASDRFKEQQEKAGI